MLPLKGLLYIKHRQFVMLTIFTIRPILQNVHFVHRFPEIGQDLNEIVKLSRYTVRTVLEPTPGKRASQ